ncbi:MAG: hypothetical protein K6G11_01340, partial [Lachnospiraceae bacterium]|nr:hypothetical protein [Lachnospiraceae bacterium]
LASVLCEAGYKVGTYTSPYLLGYTDSYRIYSNQVETTELNAESIQTSANEIPELNEDNKKTVALEHSESITEKHQDRIQKISPEEFASLCDLIKEAEAEMDDKPTEFEIMTAITFIYFERNNCDIAIVECGLGGDTDATNVLQNKILSIITNISLDHTSWIGSTKAEIATHKAGIIKENVPVVLGDFKNSPEALKVIENRAKELNCRLHSIINSFSNVYQSMSGLYFDYNVCNSVFDKNFSAAHPSFPKIRLSLFGNYQLENAAIVLEATDVLKKCGLDIADEHIYRGLRMAKHPARFEILSEKPLIIYDGGHNIACVREVVRTIDSLFAGATPTQVSEIETSPAKTTETETSPAKTTGTETDSDPAKTTETETDSDPAKTTETGTNSDPAKTTETGTNSDPAKTTETETSPAKTTETETSPAKTTETGTKTTPKSITHIPNKSGQLNYNIYILTGVMADKDYKEMAALLAPYAKKVFAVTPDNPRALPGAELAQVYESLGVSAEGYENVADGLKAAYKFFHENEVTGTNQVNREVAESRSSEEFPTTGKSYIVQETKANHHCQTNSNDKKTSVLLILGTLYQYDEVKRTLNDILHLC